MRFKIKFLLSVARVSLCVYVFVSLIYHDITLKPYSLNVVAVPGGGDGVVAGMCSRMLFLLLLSLLLLPLYNVRSPLCSGPACESG